MGVEKKWKTSFSPVEKDTYSTMSAASYRSHLQSILHWLDPMLPSIYPFHVVLQVKDAFPGRSNTSARETVIETILSSWTKLTQTHH